MQPPHTIVRLNRSVAIRGVSGIAQITALYERPFVVLLGEPGIGKTSVLTQRATELGIEVQSVAAFMTSSSPTANVDQPVLLDGLDVYRLSTPGDQKVHSIVQRLKEQGARRWWISCRAIDWQASDELAINELLGGDRVTIATLCSLVEEEGVAVLRALGRHDAEGFWREAKSRQAAAFLGSPLTLKYLHLVIEPGSPWPTSRADLYDQVVEKATREADQQRITAVNRPDPPALRRFAESVCLVYLLTRARGIWRSASEQPAGHKMVDLASLELGSAAQFVLNTPLFAPLSEACDDVIVPAHQTLAEYLGAAALARRVIQCSQEAPALSFRRARRLLIGSGHRPPSDLRGLHAWFAVHLSIQGVPSDAHCVSELVKADPQGVWAYGDATVLPSASRRALLHSLANDEPHFLDGRTGDEAIALCGSLVDARLVDDLQVLLRPADDTDLTRALLAGLCHSPISAMRSVLTTLVLEPRANLPFRALAWDAITAEVIGSDRQALAASLFDSLEADPHRVARQTIRMRLAYEMPSLLTAEQLHTLIVEHNHCALVENVTCGSWEDLTEVFTQAVRPELLEAARELADPLWDPDVDRFLSALVAASIRQLPPDSAQQIISWCKIVRGVDRYSLEPDLQQAIGDWVCAKKDRAQALFEVIFADADLCANTCGNFVLTAGQHPSDELVAHLFDGVSNPLDSDGFRRLSVAVDIAVAKHPDAATRQMVQRKLDDTPGAEPLKRRLNEGTTSREKLAQEMQHRLSGRQQQSVPGLALWASTAIEQLESLAKGDLPSELDVPARQYFRYESWSTFCKGLDPALAAAISKGWDKILQRLSVLPVHEAGQPQPGTLAALAGLANQLETDSQVLLPLNAALLSLTYGLFMNSHQLRLHRWAASRLEQDPTTSGPALNALWRSAQQRAYDSRLGGLKVLSQGPIGGAMDIALPLLLDEPRQAHSKSFLQQLLECAIAEEHEEAQRMDSATLLRLAIEALDDPAIPVDGRMLWLGVAFGLDPESHRCAVYEVASQAVTSELVAELSDALLLGCRFDLQDPIKLVAREACLVFLFGPMCKPEDWSEDRGGMVTRISARVRKAIRTLAAIAFDASAQALAVLEKHELLGVWRESLRQARMDQSRKQCDHSFVAPDVDTVLAVVSGLQARTSADLHAVICDALQQFESYLQTAAWQPWMAFWNTGANGQVLDFAKGPKVENVCRNYIADRLVDRLTYRYRLNALPEFVSRNNNRVDLCVMDQRLRIPLELKRAHHPQLWQAKNQLAVYRSEPETQGWGVLVILWFGQQRVPKHPIHGKPASAAQLCAWLKEDLSYGLSPEELHKVDVIVLDVANCGLIASRANSRQASRTKKAPARTAR